MEYVDDDVWQLLTPEDFFEFAIPFEMRGDTKVRIGGFCYVLFLFLETCLTRRVALRIL